MDHFAELDALVKETSICIVDDTGRIAREVKANGPAEGSSKPGLPQAGPLSALEPGIAGGPPATLCFLDRKPFSPLCTLYDIHMTLCTLYDIHMNCV
jgi:hypothetical protein